MPIDIQTAAPPPTPEEAPNLVSPEHCPEAKRKAYQKTDHEPTKQFLETKDQPVVKKNKKEKPGPAPKVEEFTESDQEARYRV